MFEYLPRRWRFEGIKPQGPSWLLRSSLNFRVRHVWASAIAAVRCPQPYALGSMATPSISICTRVFILYFPNIINFVLLTFKDNLFQSNHIFNLLSSSLMSSCNFSKLSPEQKTFVSSAKSTIDSSFDTWQISFIYKIKSLGPSIDPWGTPQAMSKHFEQCLPSFTNCCCLSK